MSKKLSVLVSIATAVTLFAFGAQDARAAESTTAVKTTEAKQVKRSPKKAPYGRHGRSYMTRERILVANR